MRFARRLFGLTITFAAAAWISAADAAELEIVNESLKSIQHLYIAPAGGRDWGRDLLSGAQPATIGPGDHRTIADLAPATYDLRLIDEDGAECEIQGIEVQTTIKVQLTDTQLAECATSN